MADQPDAALIARMTLNAAEALAQAIRNITDTVPAWTGARIAIAAAQRHIEAARTALDAVQGREPEPEQVQRFDPVVPVLDNGPDTGPEPQPDHG